MYTHHQESRVHAERLYLLCRGSKAPRPDMLYNSRLSNLGHGPLIPQTRIGLSSVRRDAAKISGTCDGVLKHELPEETDQDPMDLEDLLCHVLPQLWCTSAGFSLKEFRVTGSSSACGRNQISLRPYDGVTRHGFEVRLESFPSLDTVKHASPFYLFHALHGCLGWQRPKAGSLILQATSFCEGEGYCR